MTTRMSVDFVDADSVPVFDRGFMYGDGLFETLRIVGGRMPLWERHAARLREGCARLRIPLPDLPSMHDEVVRLVAELPDAVARVTVTRGTGERGYAPPSSPETRVVVSVTPLALGAMQYVEGIAVRLCDTRLADQPLLAGIKHLNRIEQVMARAEWSDPAIGEGLVADMAGNVVCATAANVFAVFGDTLVTPALDRCGVAGVARAEIAALRPVSLSSMNPERLAGADEVFLTSAVRGILPVRAFAARTWRPGPVTRALQAHWRDIGLPLPSDPKDSDR